MTITFYVSSLADAEHLSHGEEEVTGLLVCLKPFAIPCQLDPRAYEVRRREGMDPLVDSEGWVHSRHTARRRPTTP